ncbi:unnamed protein product [Notodromas monacha]|uniref:Uncharacterized protein n=1 Tax=Notodromas monacha TaxID=399045 RepID=A0A7R9BI91_9CRUS|nr:unnamed protein product [Notodromas monacha]CAG0914928.1 unnamed protein product [Notodromas monacha]
MKGNAVSDFVTAGIIAGLLLTVVAFSGVDAVECYLCSWSNRDFWNMTGLCYPGNFTSNYGIRMECPKGCEMSFLFDKDGIPTHFYRNCAPANRPISNQWKTHHNDYGYRKMYTCDWHLCNGAMENLAPSSISLFLVLQLSMWVTSFFVNAVGASQNARVIQRTKR